MVDGLSLVQLGVALNLENVVEFVVRLEAWKEMSQASR